MTIPTLNRLVAGRRKSIGSGTQFAPIWALISSFRSNARANVAVISALAAVPMISAVGCAVDYTTASMLRTKLQAGADAASLAAVSINSPVIQSRLQARCVGRL